MILKEATVRAGTAIKRVTEAIEQIDKKGDLQ
jgi:hypothetical protein